MLLGTYVAVASVVALCGIVAHGGAFVFFPLALLASFPAFMLTFYSNPVPQTTTTTSLGMRALLTTLLHCRVFAVAAFGMIHVVLALHVIGEFRWFDVRGINPDLLEHDLRHAALFAFVFVCSGFLVFFGTLLIDRGAIDHDGRKDGRVRDVVAATTLAIGYWTLF